MSLRSLLTPFLKAVMAALVFEFFRHDESAALFDKIIQNVPAENSTSNLLSHWIQASDDLEFEFDGLLDLQ